MTEFRAPPPPPDLDWNPDSDSADSEGVTPRINPKMVGVAVGLVLIGIFIGAVAFSSKQQTVVQQGLTNVIPNRDIRNRLPICGTVEPTRECVLYILNYTQYDKTAQNFFQDAADMLSRNKTVIEMVNPEYSKVRIPRGKFAQIKIPALH